MAHDVFISYASSDKLTSDAACAVLESKGLRCWMAPRDILPGMDYGEAIIDAIGEVKVFLLVFSSHANASNQIKREVERAVNRGIPVIPLRIEDVAPTKSLEYFISSPHWLDAFSPPLQRHLDYLAEVIQSLLTGGATTSSLIPQNGIPAPRSAVLGMKSGATNVWLGLGLLVVVALLIVMTLRSGGGTGSRPTASAMSVPAAKAIVSPVQEVPLQLGATLVGRWYTRGVTCDDPINISIGNGVISVTLSGKTESARMSPGKSGDSVVTHSPDGDFSYALENDVLTMTGPEGPMELSRCAG